MLAIIDCPHLIKFKVFSKVLFFMRKNHHYTPAAMPHDISRNGKQFQKHETHGIY